MLTSSCSELFYTIQINHQPDATIFQFIILTFIYSSTCFGLTTNTAWLSPSSDGKPEAATAVTGFLMMCGRTPETCWAVNKCQDNKLENCCIWLVIYSNCTMMHGLTNLKFILYSNFSLCKIFYYPLLPLQASLKKLFQCQQQNFSPPPKFIVKNELHEGQRSRMSLRWVQPPLRWLEEIINWGSSVSKRGQCFYACRPANNIIQDCQAQNGV